MRFLAIGLMCGAMICFAGLDTCAKWLSASLPIAQIVWARYVGASLIALVASRSLTRPATLRSRRPRLQLLRSALPFCSTTANVFAVRELQLSETATISFLTPVFVALLAGPVLGERVSSGTHDRNRARFSRRGDRDAPGSRGVSANRSCRGRRGGLQFGIRAGDPQTCRVELRPDDARLDPNRRHRILNSDIALDLAAAPVGGRLGDHGGNGRFRGHQPRNADNRASVCPSADLDPVYLHPAHLDDRFRRCWFLAIGLRPQLLSAPAWSWRAALISRFARGGGAAPSKPAN